MVQSIQVGDTFFEVVQMTVKSPKLELANTINTSNSLTLNNPPYTCSFKGLNFRCFSRLAMLHKTYYYNVQTLTVGPGTASGKQSTMKFIQ